MKRGIADRDQREGIKAGITIHVPEKNVAGAFRQVLELDGWIVRHLEATYSERKRQGTGEVGMPDFLAIRYKTCTGLLSPREIKHNLESGFPYRPELVWWEMKTERRGKPTKPTATQLEWHRRERARGAVTWIAGVEFPATIEGAIAFARKRGYIR